MEMKIINVVNKLKWANSNGSMNPKTINVVVIHHDAVFMPQRYNTLTRLQKEAEFHVANGWGHISYHFSIDNIGDIYQCLPETEIGYHCGNLAINRKSIAIKLDGNFDVQEPTVKQIQALKDLLIWLTTKRPDLPKVVRESVKGHRDIKATSCPGKNLYPLIFNF